MPRFPFPASFWIVLGTQMEATSITHNMGCRRFYTFTDLVVQPSDTGKQVAPATQVPTSSSGGSHATAHFIGLNEVIDLGSNLSCEASFIIGFLVSFAFLHFK